MKNLVHPPLKCSPKRCKTSEVFCKPSNLQNASINEINSLQRTCSNRPHDLQRMCKTMKTQQRQGLTAFKDHHCKHPPGLHQGGSKSPLVLNRGPAKLQVVHRIAFARCPEIGTVLMLEGQRYVLVDCTPHTKANGQPTFLLHWESHCPDCGATFLVKTGLKASAINRRCEQHHRMGVPVAKGSKAWRGGRK